MMRGPTALNCVCRAPVPIAAAWLLLALPALSADDSSRRTETGSLESGDVRLSSGEYIDEFPLAGKAGQFVILELHSSEFNAFLQMSPREGSNAPAGLEWHNNDMRATTTDACLAVTLPVDADYIVYVTSAAGGEKGGYELAVTVLPEPVRAEAGQLAADDRTLSGGEYCDYFDFEARAGELWVIDVTGADFDTYVFGRSVDDKEFRVDNNDAFGDTHHSQVLLTIPRDGKYFAGVTSSEPGETGGYQVTLSSTSALTLVDERPRPGDVQRGASALGLPQQRVITPD